MIIIAFARPAGEEVAPTTAAAPAACREPIGPRTHFTGDRRFRSREKSETGLYYSFIVLGCCSPQTIRLTHETRFLESNNRALRLR